MVLNGFRTNDQCDSSKDGLNKLRRLEEVSGIKPGVALSKRKKGKTSGKIIWAPFYLFYFNITAFLYQYIPNK